MSRAIILLTLAMSATTGCTLCSSPFDHDYVTYGSRTPRQDMKHGRVGSPFSDPSLGTVSRVQESVEAIDDGYSQVLESEGPVFLDEPLDEVETIPRDASTLFDDRDL